LQNALRIEPCLNNLKVFHVCPVTCPHCHSPHLCHHRIK
jgi:hypothetical protein